MDRVDAGSTFVSIPMKGGLLTAPCRIARLDSVGFAGLGLGCDSTLSFFLPLLAGLRTNKMAN